MANYGLPEVHSNSKINHTEIRWGFVGWINFLGIILTGGKGSGFS
jgi:hypothetical protein